MANFQTFKTWLSGRADGTVLGLFRILFGAVMVVEMLWYFSINIVEKGLLAPKMLFKYEGFEWVEPMSGPVMKGLLFTMLVCAVLMTTGLFFKWACRVFALFFAYFFLCDKSLFNNHLYMFFLVSILFSLTNADDFLSMKNEAKREKTTANWMVFMLQFQVMVVYFFGGVEKLNPDWIFRQEPVRALVSGRGFLDNELIVHLFTWGGLIIDLFAPILLWWKPARRYAIWAYIFFHSTNAVIFNDIGVFPYTMLAALLLYYETHELGFLKTLFGKNEAAPKVKKRGQQVVHSPLALEPKPVGAGLQAFLIGWVIVQMVVPLRGYFLPNPQDFTTIGNRFSWHMKIDSRKKEELKFLAINPPTRDTVEVELDKYFHPMQLMHLSADPRSVAAFARLLRGEMTKQGFPETQIKATIRFTYNGRKGQLLVDPNVDLSRAECDIWKPIDWVMPLKK